MPTGAGSIATPGRSAPAGRKRERRPWHNPLPQVVKEGYATRIACCRMSRRLGVHDPTAYHRTSVSRMGWSASQQLRDTTAFFALGKLVNKPIDRNQALLIAASPGVVIRKRVVQLLVFFFKHLT